MGRRPLLILVALSVMLAVAAIGLRPAGKGLLVLDWANKASSKAPPKAILIELGLKDAVPTSWSGSAKIANAKIVHREGYRFHNEDELTPDGWKATSHRPVRIPPGKPAVAAMEGIQTVGVVCHLTDIGDDATVTIQAEGKKEPVTVSLKEVLAGQAQKLWGGAGVVRLVTTATPVATGPTEDDFPAAAYGPDGTLWVAYNSYHLKEESRRIEPPKLDKQPDDFKAYDTPEFGDQVFVKSFKDGKWSEPLAVTGPKKDIVRCAVAVEGSGTVWVIYSEQRDGQHRLYVRPIDKGKLGAEEALRGGGADTRSISPVACTDQKGNVWVACQTWDLGGRAAVEHYQCVAGRWLQQVSVVTEGNCWHVAIAAGPSGDIVQAFDCYRGDYDIILNRWKGGAAEHTVAATSAFEARPSIAFDPKGRLWLAYELGPEKWGKDYGALDDKDGNPLYFQRTVRVVCVQDGKTFEPVAELPPLAPRVESPATGQQVEAIPRYAYPQIGIDGKGRVWLTYRVKFGSRYTTQPGPYWLTFARRLDGDRWTEPIEVHHSDGLLDHRPVLLPHAAGGITIIHNTDGRYTTPEKIDNQIYMSYLDLPGDPVEPKLVPRKEDKKNPEAVAQAKKEQEAVKRIKDYRVEAGGKKYQLLRGEFHRHTEISWDGGPDGSLEDMYRYGIDAAGMDWIGNGDHDNGGGREYSWWLTQKFADAYHVPGRFSGMFSYERSVPYPHGHRNAIFARRGIRTLPRLDEPDKEKRVANIHADDTKMFYRYLKELGGICASHTSATSMGTDWRDNDPIAEPIVEIYQGDRMSYEMEEAPRAGYDPKSDKKPANIAGWYPKGFINLALEQGHRLGFQSSSDHFSTHISYCIVLAEKNEREAILDGLKKRHCYGATDDIILDVKSGEHLMGDEFESAKPALDIHVIGTDTLATVEVLKNSKVVETYKPGKRHFKARWEDPAPAAGTHYYYVRVVQADGELAWGSPMWMRRK